MSHHVGWFEIRASDLDKASSWYHELFGWDIERIDGMDYALVNTGSDIGGGLTGDGTDVTIYVETDDLDATLQTATDLGAAVVVPVTEVPGFVTFAQFADPDGNTIGLVQVQPPSDDPTRHVVFYHPAADVLTRAVEHQAAHGARLAEFRHRGLLLQVGTFGDPQSQGSMSVFTSREAADEFISGDPFVLNGLIEHYEIRSWDLAW